MTDEAPAAIALVTSPEYLIPPSEMIGTFARAAAAHSATAVNCGTPAPATIRVVQMEPGPTPTLMASGPAAIRSRTDRKSTRLNSSHSQISYAVFCLKKKKKYTRTVKLH